MILSYCRRVADYTYQQIAKMIDHSLLRPEMTWDELESGVDLALEYDVASVCALPFYVPRLFERLGDSSVRTSTTIGFPHGANSTRAKVFEATDALDAGCQELDFVVNLSRVKSGAWDDVHAEIRALVQLAQDRGARVKAIFETSALVELEKRRLCEICSELGTDWVKTSTGFGSGGATEQDVQLLRSCCPERIGVKASGGVRTLAAVLRFRELGTSRVGTSNTRAILDECRLVGAG